MSISVILPTLGRPCLRKVLDELRTQLSAQDEVLVIGDGPVGAESVVEEFGKGFRYLEHGPDHAWGGPQRNFAIPFARGSHLMFVDDDDAILKDSLRDVRQGIKEDPDRPLMFRMYEGPLSLWREMTLVEGNVSTQMFVTPNVAGRLGTWSRRYAGDFDFIKSTVTRYPDNALVWRSEFTVIHGINGRAPR